MNSSRHNPTSEESTVKDLSTMKSSQPSHPVGGPSEATELGKTEKSEQTGKIRKPRFKRIEHKYPVEPRVIQVIKKPKTYMDHTYRDFSQVPPETGYVHPTKIDDMTFAQKVFAMLSDETISNWMYWLPHGRSFRIAVPKRLEQSKTIQRYFGHNRYSSFLRQLNNHGFKHLTKGPDRNCYYHECMLRGMPHLTKYMPPGRDARRLMADPDNEPDFYAIDRLFPLASGNSKANLNMPLIGIGGQTNLHPFFGGMSNFQQLPPGFLRLNPSVCPQQQPINSMDPGQMANFGNYTRMDTLNQTGNSAMQPVGGVPPFQSQQPAGVAPTNSLAALLLQQQQSQQQRVQSSHDEPEKW